MFSDICLLGYLDPKDIIPNCSTNSVLPSDEANLPTDPVTFKFEPQTLYAAIKYICDVYDMGFRLIRGQENSQLYFNVYLGHNRTSKQVTFPAVIFSPTMENIRNTRSLSSSVGYKNVAYVLSPVGFEIVYPEVVDQDIDGLERSVLLVHATDITNPVPAQATAEMIVRGRQELALHRRLMGFDGEISQNNRYIYGTDYNLGDLVEFRSYDHLTNIMRVTEQIFVSDAEGDRSYPTLTFKEFVMPGSWAAWNYSQVWEDLDANVTLTWDTA